MAVRRTADGEAVFTAGLAGLVLGEYRKLATSQKGRPELTARETEVLRLLAVSLTPVAALVTPRRARHTACQWALSLRFPAENLAGLTPATRAAFEAARVQALWLHGELLGLTSGYRDAATQTALFAAEVARTGSERAARRALPAHESRHVAGVALDVRPTEGARWLEEFGAPYEDGGIRVTVRDDGAGFEPQRLDEAARAGRLGVEQSIRGRIRDLGGTTAIKSRPSRGTEVELWIPRRR